MNANPRLPLFPPQPWLWLLVSIAIVALDMWTKELASTHLELYRPLELLSWLNLTLAHNYGAAFSFLSDAGGWQRWLFTFIPGAIAVVVLIWLLRLPRGDWRVALALSLILGGAIGNLAGRIEFGYVVDFVDVYYKDIHFPAFNVADSSIFCGVVLLIADGLFFSSPKRQAAEESAG